MQTIKTCVSNNYFSFDEIKIKQLSKGLENKNFYIEIDNVGYIFRIYSLTHSSKGFRKATDVDEELNFISYLKEKGIPTPKVIKCINDSFYTTIELEDGIHFASLFEFIAGKEADSFTPERARAIANVLYAIRHANKEYKYTITPSDYTNIFEQSLNFYEKNLLNSGAYAEKLQIIYEETKGIYPKFISQNLPQGLIHNDIKLENLLFKDNGVAAVLDFDDYRKGYYLEDMTRTIMHDLDSREKNVVRCGTLTQFLEVFEKDKEFRDKEAAYLKPLMRARFLYDVINYLQNGHTQLVEELFRDANIQKLILS